MTAPAQTKTCKIAKKKDSNNTNRSVWIFPLQLKEGFELQIIEDKKIKQLSKIRTKEVKKLVAMA